MVKNAYIEKFLGKRAENRYSPKSITTYRYPLQRFSSFLAAAGRPSFRDVTPETLERYRLDLIRSNFAGESVVTYLQAVRKFFAYLEAEGVIFSNPATNFKNPRAKRTIKNVPSVEDMERLLAGVNTSTAIGVRDRAMIETAYSCALRMNELLRLTLFNADFGNRTLRVLGKGGKERILPLGTQATKWLKVYLAKARPKLGRNLDTNALWLSSEGKPLSGISYQKMLHHYAQQAKLAGKVTGHAIRRACATHLLENGAHPVAIQHLLGHASLKHLGSYLMVRLTDLRKTHEKSAVGR